MPSLFFLLFSLLLVPSSVWAYPEFIGYKYSSCVTCHYNGHGNGAINDYGRALWASEIGARTFSGQQTSEELAKSSGFLGKTELPWWIRPGLKSRYLAYNTNPGKSESETRTIIMQADANIALLFDKKQTFIFVGSYGYVPVPYRIQNQPGATEPDEWISREHYFRWQYTKSLWLYAGMMDKVYGIRLNNHTAYSRSRTGLAQNDQSHGVVVHYIQPKWELSANGFMGNLFQDEEVRQKGFSVMYDYELEPNFRLGFSVLKSSNTFVDLERFGVHIRNGLGNGSALLFELGAIGNKPKNSESKLGYYLYSEAIQRLIRGYHLFIVGQAYKEDMSGQYTDNMKVGFGFLMFPFTRTELRIEAENTRKLARDEVQPDVWALLAQLHLSF